MCKNRDILNGEECQNVEKLGHTYERKRTEKMGQFVLPYVRDGLTATFLTWIWPPQRGCHCWTSEATQPEVVGVKREGGSGLSMVCSLCVVCAHGVCMCARVLTQAHTHAHTYTCPR